MDLKHFLIERYKLTEAEWELTISMYQPRKINAKQYFLKEGEISNTLAIIMSGVFRTFIINDDGDDVTLQFHEPNTVLICPESFNNRTPSKENMIALADAELLEITYENMMHLYNQVPAWPKICMDVAEHKNQMMTERLKSFQQMTAAMRYEKFCREHPLVIQQSPLKHVASYLGIDIATLSRIRAAV